jgi:hypothetical protein
VCIFHLADKLFALLLHGQMDALLAENARLQELVAVKDQLLTAKRLSSQLKVSFWLVRLKRRSF